MIYWVGFSSREELIFYGVVYIGDVFERCVLIFKEMILELELNRFM